MEIFNFLLGVWFAGHLLVWAKTQSKTREQVEKLSSSPFPIAGRTGAGTEEMDLAAVSSPQESTNQSIQSDSGPYSIKFIQHGEQQSSSVQRSLVTPSSAALSLQPETGFALKQTSGKRVLFSLEQKQIMIAFYDRQAEAGIRAEPRDVIAEMQRRGLAPLTESQIKSWWSTYHQKKKRQMQNLVEEAQQLRQMCSSVNETQSSSPSTVRSAVPLPSPSVQAPLSVPMATCTSAAPCATTAPTAAQAPHSVPIVMCASAAPRAFTATTAAQAPIGIPVVPYSIPSGVPNLRIYNSVLECSFPFEFSQSSINGRNGSNACTFISLCFGRLFTEQKLSLPFTSNLNSWTTALHYAMVKGNDIHDALFDNEAVNLSVQDAVEMAGDEFGVHSLGQQHDFFGAQLPQDLANYIHGLSSKKERQCVGIVTTGRTMLFVFDENQAAGLVDSHQHGAQAGAVIACVAPNDELHLIAWFIDMMKRVWNCDLNTCSLTVIQY